MGRKSHPFFDKREYHRTKREGLTRLGQNGSEGWARFRSSAELVGYFAVHRLSHGGGRYYMGQHHKVGNHPRCGTEA